MSFADKIRTIPDFPQPGITFRDITPLLADAAAFTEAVAAMTRLFGGVRVDRVVAIEARGYIFGAPIALRMNAGFVPVRKVGKLPSLTYRADYDMEYGSTSLEVHQDGLVAGQRVLIVDDVLATGGTLAATAKLVEQSGAQVVGMCVLIELESLKGRARLSGYRVETTMRM